MHSLAVTTINLCELLGHSVGFVVLPSWQCGDHNTTQFSSVNHEGSETLCMTGNPDYIQVTNENLEEKIRIEISVNEIGSIPISGLRAYIFSLLIYNNCFC